MNIVIVSPHGNAGGVIVLRKLCNMLVECGINAKVLYLNCLYPVHNFVDIMRVIKDNTFYALRCIKYRTPVSLFVNKEHAEKFNFIMQKCPTTILPFITKKTIVVYPDIVYGNPLHAKNIIRYMLYYPTYSKDSGAYGENDVFIFYREAFNDVTLNSGNNYVNVHSIDQKTYKQFNFSEREGTCYFVRKGANRTDLPTIFDGPILDELSENNKVKALNEYKYCYIYDTQTAYARIAAICGCIPIVVPEQSKSRSDYLCTGEKGYGVAYGDSQSEIDFAINTRNIIFEEERVQEKKNKDNISKFISICKRNFPDVFK